MDKGKCIRESWAVQRCEPSLMREFNLWKKNEGIGFNIHKCLPYLHYRVKAAWDANCSFVKSFLHTSLHHTRQQNTCPRTPSPAKIWPIRYSSDIRLFYTLSTNGLQLIQCDSMPIILRWVGAWAYYNCIWSVGLIRHSIYGRRVN